MAVNAAGDDRIFGGDRVEILTRGKFFHGPEGVVPAIDDDPFTGLVVLQASADALLKFGERFCAFRIYVELDVGGTGEVQVSVVETGHDELAVEIEDAGVGTFPFLNIRRGGAVGRSFIGNGDDFFTADGDRGGRGMVTVVHGFDIGVGENQIRGTVGGRGGSARGAIEILRGKIFSGEADADKNSDEEHDRGQDQRRRTNHFIAANRRAGRW